MDLYYCSIIYKWNMLDVQLFKLTIVFALLNDLLQINAHNKHNFLLNFSVSDWCLNQCKTFLLSSENITLECSQACTHVIINEKHKLIIIWPSKCIQIFLTNQKILLVLHPSGDFWRVEEVGIEIFIFWRALDTQENMITFLELWYKNNNSIICQ